MSTPAANAATDPSTLPRGQRDAVIVARGLTRRFGQFTAGDRLDLDVRRAEVYGFLGPNGSGKSTTIRMLCGLLDASEGTVEVLGHALPAGAEAAKRSIGYMTQKFSLYEDLGVGENLEFLAAVHELRGAAARRRIDELCARYRLDELRGRLAGTLSGGQKQRLALACAVLHEPELLLLDEPTSAVDPQSRRDFWDSLFDLADTGTTLLVSTHYMDEAERCHRLAILDHGRLVADGTPQELMGALPGTTLRIECAQPRRVQQVVARDAHVVGVAQIGSDLRVLTDRREDGADRLRRLLAAAGLEGRVEPAPPNLEDVFVAVTRTATGERT